MPSPESFPSGEPTDEKAPVGAPETSTETGTDDSEVIGEKERKTYEERGEKTLEAEKATAAEKATKSELEKEREKLMEEIRMLKMRREILIKYGAKPKSERVSDDKPEETTSESDSAAAAAAAATAAAVAGAAAGAEKPTSESKPEGTAEDEPASPEDIKEVKKRAKKNSAARKYAAGVCALIAAAGIGLGIWGAAKGNRADDASLNGTPAVITVANEAGERMKGIYDGYGEKGMYLSEHKTSSVAFANATEVAEVCNADEVDMILYTAHNQVESFADYLANLPEELQPDGFKGLNLTQTEAKLESLSPEEFTALEGTFATIMDNALTRRVTLNGRYDNAYMRVKNPGQDIVHENMELVRCTTNENNLEVTQFYWTDASGREIGTMTVKMTPIRDEKGVISSFKGCEQVVNPEGSSTIYTGMPEIPDPDTPTPPGPDTPTPPGPDTPTPPGPDTPDLTPKDPQQEIAHAGPDVTPLELDEDVTPPTTLEQDQANFSAIEQQRQEDAARQAEAERVAAQQAEAERQAAVQAEARRQAEAEAAAQRSAEAAAAEAARQAEANRAAEAAAQQAAQEQQARAAEEAAAAQEAAARQQAQAAAEAAAAQAAPEAASHADDSAAERANLFENGDF